MCEPLPDFVEINIETASMLRDGLSRAPVEPRDDSQPKWLNDFIDFVRSKERVQLLDIPPGLRVHYSEDVKVDVFSAVEKTLDIENPDESPHSLYDSETPSECDGYFEVLRFSLKLDDDQPEKWTVPRFPPKTLFDLLEPHADGVKVISLADPLKGYKSRLS